MVDHLDDLDADFRAFYGIAGVGDGHFGDLSGPRFLALAVRTTAYAGVMAAWLAEQDKPDARPAQLTPQAVGDRTVDGTRDALTADAALAGVIDFG